MEFVEVRELDGEPAEIVPHAGQDLFDLGVGFFRKGGAQVLAAEAVFLEQRPSLAHQRAGEIGGAPAIHELDRAHQPNGDAPTAPSSSALKAPTSSMIRKSGRRFSERIMLHQRRWNVDQRSRSRT